SFTQPRTYAAVNRQPTVRERFAGDLVRRGVVREGDPEAFLKAGLGEVQRRRGRGRRDATPPVGGGRKGSFHFAHGDAQRRPVEPPTWERLKNLNAALLTFPDGFNVHPKLIRALERRRVAFDKPDGSVDWAHAETLAFATLIDQGVPIRLTGQDTVR